MSKTPLQLYINEGYNDTVSGYVNKNRNHQEKSKKHRSDKNDNKYAAKQSTFRQMLETYTCSNHSLGSKIIFRNYLREHQKSIADYYNLQKQQQDILRLCKEKIAKKFPPQLVANLADEDVIRALKIAQNSDGQMGQSRSSDQIVDAILRIITSNEEQKRTKKKVSSKSSYSQLMRSSPEPYYETGKNVGNHGVFKRFMGVFKKHKVPADKFFPKQECTYLVKSEKKERCGKCSKRPPCACPNKKESGGRKSSETSDSAIDTDSSVTPNRSDPNLGCPKCTCHTRVKKITNDIKRQQYQIREIQNTLQNCLTILKRIDHPSNSQYHPSDLPPKPVCPGLQYSNDYQRRTDGSEINIPGLVQHQYRVETKQSKTKASSKTNLNKTKPKSKQKKKCCSNTNQKSSDSSQKSEKKGCSPCCKKKKKSKRKAPKATSDKTVHASPEKLNNSTITSGSTVPSKTKTKSKSSLETPSSTLVSTNNDDDEEEEEVRPKTRKQKRAERKRKKRAKKVAKKEKKKQAKIEKRERDKKRCCLISCPCRRKKKKVEIKKPKVSDKNVYASTQKLNNSTMTSYTNIPPKPVQRDSKSSIGSSSSLLISVVSYDEGKDIRPKPRKGKRTERNRKKLQKKEVEQTRKRQQPMAQRERKKKRCCLIRLIQFICCSGCCA